MYQFKSETTHCPVQPDSKVMLPYRLHGSTTLKLFSVDLPYHIFDGSGLLMDEAVFCLLPQIKRAIARHEGVNEHQVQMIHHSEMNADLEKEIRDVTTLRISAEHTAH